MDTLRESAVGQIIRYVTKNKYLVYPEEQEGFHWAPLVRLPIWKMDVSIADKN